MKSERAIRDVVSPTSESDVEISWRDEDDAASDRRFLEMVRRIRDKHRARAGQLEHSRRR